jgi:hypothetical protein
MNSVSPVLTERELFCENVIAIEQTSDYHPIICARVDFENSDTVASYTRYRLTDKEREAIARGADVLISQPHHGPMMPLGVQLAFPGEYPLEEKLLI